MRSFADLLGYGQESRNCARVRAPPSRVFMRREHIRGMQVSHGTEFGPVGHHLGLTHRESFWWSRPLLRQLGREKRSPSSGSGLRDDEPQL
jgi:hypothetical protein